MVAKNVMMAVMAMVFIIILLGVFVLLRNQIWDLVRAQGRSIIDGINGMTSNRPPWLH